MVSERTGNGGRVVESKNMSKSNDKQLKEYLIIVDDLDMGFMFLVSAGTKKEAIDIVWKNEFEWRVEESRRLGDRPTYKKDLKAYSVSELHKEHGDVINVA